MKNIFVGIFFVFITDHTQALDVVPLKIGIPYFEYGYIPTQFLDQPLYACVEAELEYGESLWYWIDFEQRSPLYQDYNEWVLLWTKGFLRDDLVDTCFTIPEPQQRFTMYLNATSNMTSEINKHRTFDTIHGIYVGNIEEYKSNESLIIGKLWPDLNRVPGYLQSDYQCTDVYTVAANDIVTINYGIQNISGYIHKLTIQENSLEYPLSNWEQDRPEYIVNEELLIEGRSYLQFTAPKNMDIRIFFYTFAKQEIYTPLMGLYWHTVTTHRIIKTGSQSETPKTVIKPTERTYPASILCPRS
ncbi:uncharacterized protein LOC122852647 [Aphidius gifuensis]|uniref:uncharacterized protein LOC122852647 n=1 Tax=Aphidius gifuensis TaxID=684658 RepID=UPI001CDBB0D0|nr:uncharacterized protein LOC122852647 [Aphidius gifuensis]